MSFQSHANPGFIIRAGRGTTRAMGGPVAGSAGGPNHEEALLKNLFRALIAGYGAKKMGGGCISTILIFLLLYWLLGIVF